MLFQLKGELIELGHTEYDGKSYPFVKILTRIGSRADLVRVGLAKADGLKVGDKVDWPVEVSLAENDRGRGRISAKRVVEG